MDKQQARNVIKETFEQPFDKARYTVFIKNLLNQIEDAPFTYQGQFIPDAYKPYVHTLERIGKYSDGEHAIDILAVRLKKDSMLERARTRQRNFVAWYLNGSRGGELKDAAVVAFVSPDETDWRFSLVKMEYKFKQTKAGSMKVQQEFTPARRWSFIVGVDEKSHTAQSRLMPILANDEINPTLAELEEAFNIETVTREFFLKYRDLFIGIKEALDKEVKKDPKLKADFEDKGVNTVDFAKKLLGQIVFLYFLQKKGWFGAKRDADWGSGSKHFLRELFEKKHCNYKNFFNDILEPLFYEALRNDRRHNDDYYSRYKCKIPFLNGGLFDPVGNYDWVHTDICLPDKLFCNNNSTKEGDIGDGILDIFDRYNFTVKEDEPLEKEVAIDPELLGKAYEKFNAIRTDNYEEYKKALKSGKKGDENKFNKQYGVYYTPREIVHYMCQQSLINYLSVDLNKGIAGHEKLIPKIDIETLIHHGEQVSENDARVETKGRETKTYSYKLSENIRNNAKIIDKKLEMITVCDPAVGSGAFPVGMMSEIVKARSVLSTFIENKNYRSSYNFKRRCIEHSLYGVDIDPGAVEIAKLRLWLSLVVDEDNIKNINPLPNLDYRIMQGNSLISEFMGINFDCSDNKKGISQILINERNELEDKFQSKKDEFLSESNVSRKSKLKESLDEILIKIFEAKLKNQKTDYFNILKNIEIKYSILPNIEQREELTKQEKEKLYKQSGFNLNLAEKQLKDFTSGKKIKPFFLWSLYFSEIFQNNNGFNVVIGNPPYLNVELVSKEHKKYFSQHFKTFYKRYDVFGLFFEMSLTKLVKDKGSVAFIIPQQIFNNLSYKKLRDLMLNNKWLNEVLYLGDKIFTEANNDVCVLFLLKPSSNKIKLVNALDYKHWTTNEVSLDHFEKYNNIISFSHDLDGENIFEKIFNNNHETLKTQFDVFQGIVTGNNSAFLPTKEEIKNAKIESGLLQTILLGRDFEKWLIRNKDRQIIYINGDTNIDKFENTKKWLLPFKNKLKLRRECKRGIIPWYSLQWPRVKKQLDQIPKIMVQRTRNPRLKKRIVATIDEDGFYGMESIIFIVPQTETSPIYYLLAILNSTLINYLYSTKFLNVAIKAEYLKDTPIPKASNDYQNSISKLVQNILNLRKTNPDADISQLEREINLMVYNLYGLTQKEIILVEKQNL